MLNINLYTHFKYNLAGLRAATSPGYLISAVTRWPVYAVTLVDVDTSTDNGFTGECEWQAGEHVTGAGRRDRCRDRVGITGAIEYWEQGINVVLKIDYVMGCKAEFKVHGSSITI